MAKVTSNILPTDLRRELRRRLDEIGTSALAKEVGCTRPTIARAVGGLPIQPGSAALVREWIARR